MYMEGWQILKSKDHARYKHSRTSTLRPSACNCPQSEWSRLQDSRGRHLNQTRIPFPADSWQFWFHSFPETPHTRLGGVSLQPGTQGRAEPADTRTRERSKTATYPRSASRQRTSPLVVPREQESSGRGHWALESHCTESADDARAGGIIYWTCHWFSNGFSRGCSFHGPSQQSVNLSICHESHQRPKGTAWNPGNALQLGSWG